MLLTGCLWCEGLSGSTTLCPKRQTRRSTGDGNVSGHVSQISLPEFDPYYSAARWYRDYGSYCGVSDDGKKLYAVVVQLGRRKPILKKAMGEASRDEVPDTECSAPAWQRQPHA